MIKKFVIESSDRYNDINAQTEKIALLLTKKNWSNFDGKIINNGFCEIWARNFYYKYGGTILKTFASDGNIYSHIFIKYNNKYFDAEMPNGTENVLDLPYFQRWIKYGKIEIDSTLADRLLLDCEEKSINYLNKLIENKIDLYRKQNNKNCIQESYEYVSDNIRETHILNALNSEIDITPINKKKLIDTWDGYDDLTKVQKISDNELIYYEGFVKSCWDGLYSKSEYKGLNKIDAVDKLVNDRISEIAKNNNLGILDHTFKSNILTIKFTIL